MSSVVLVWAAAGASPASIAAKQVAAIIDIFVGIGFLPCASKTLVSVRPHPAVGGISLRKAVSRVRDGECPILLRRHFDPIGRPVVYRRRRAGARCRGGERRPR